ncbi:MAG: tyrosine-type recombinase/integrase, partial [Cyanobacteria bacterium P01_F01_bin.3]
MKLLLLTGTRSGVICGLRWEEVKEDHIFIAAEERKNGRNKLRQDYRIPLTPAIHDVLAEAKLLFDGDHYVFPGASRSKMHHFTPGAAAQKLAEVRDRLGIDYFTIHTFRHTVNTELEGLSWEEDSQINDKRRHLLLGHVVSGDVNEKVYTHRSWLRMREKLTAALQEWHETLDAIVNAPEPTSISKARSAL